jgi:hypothetical protein
VYLCVVCWTGRVIWVAMVHLKRDCFFFFCCSCDFLPIPVDASSFPLCVFFLFFLFLFSGVLSPVCLKVFNRYGRVVRKHLLLHTPHAIMQRFAKIMTSHSSIESTRFSHPLHIPKNGEKKNMIPYIHIPIYIYAKYLVYNPPSI